MFNKINSSVDFCIVSGSEIEQSFNFAESAFCTEVRWSVQEQHAAMLLHTTLAEPAMMYSAKL